MSDKNLNKQGYSIEQKRVFNIDLPDIPSIKSGKAKSARLNISKDELEGMCKNPRESAELIRYLIEFIKSL